MRSFIALNIDDNSRVNISKVMDYFRCYGVKNVKWVRTENLHFTFQFIGESSISQLEPLMQFCRHEFSTKLPLKFSNPEIELIPEHKPRLIWISFIPDKKWIFQTHKKLQKQLIANGIKPDKKRLKFHITLGRIKNELPKDFIHTVLSTKFESQKITSADLTLYQSILKPQGPDYIPINKIRLQGE